MASKRTLRRYSEPFAHDPNPLYAVARDGDNFAHWMAFDPRHGPESEAQIEWHLEHNTPGAELWEVGVPAAPYA